MTSDTKAAKLHNIAASYEQFADVTRIQVAAYDAAIQLQEHDPAWARFVELSKRAQALTVELGLCMDTLAAETEMLAASAETETY